MAYPKFNENKYKKTFDNMYGKGAFNQGMNQAREIGRTTAQAAYEKDAYTQRLKAAEKAAKEAEKAAKNKTYDDALSYWSSPEQKSYLKNGGAYDKVKDIKNDPRQQAEIKAQGFKVQDFIDAMYYVNSGGKYRSETEFNGGVKDFQKRSDRWKTKEDSTESMINKYSSNTSNKPTTKEKDDNGVLGKLGNIAKKTGNFITSKDNNPDDGKREGLLGFMDNYGMRASKAMQNVILDPLGTNNFEENQTKNFKRLAKNNQASKDPSKQKRGNELEKILKGSEGKANTKGEKAAELLGTGLGIASYILPGSASEMVATQGLNALKLTKPGSSLAAKLATQAGEKGLSAIAKTGVRSAGKGAASGLVYGAGETGLRELVDGKSQNAGENLQRIGKEVISGAVANPVLDAFGNVLTKGLGRLAKNKVPSSSIANTQDELLTLPEPQRLLNAPQTALPAPKETPSFNSVFRQPEGLNNPIPSMPDAMKQPINFGRLNKANVGFGYNAKNTPKARFDLSPQQPAIDPLKRGQQYWQNRYEEFVNTVSESYDMNRMTPEGLDQAWSQFAKIDEPISLNQVVDLAYPKGFEAPSPIKPEPQAPRTIKDDLREDPQINDAVKGLFPPTRPRQPVSKSGTFVDNANLFQDMYQSNASKTPDLQPLQFKKTINPQAEASNLNRLQNIGKPSITNENGIDDINTPLSAEGFPQTFDEAIQRLNNAAREWEKTTGTKFSKSLYNKQYKSFEKLFSNTPYDKGIGQQPSLQDALKNSLNPAKRVNPNLIENAKPGSIPIQPLKDNGGPVNGAKVQPLSAIMKKVDNKDLASEATQKALQQIKDIKSFQVATQNIYQLADRLPKPLKERITTTLDAAKKANIDTQEQLTNDLFENVVKGLGIKKGSKESALVQDFGEKKLAKDFLKERGIDYKTLSEKEMNAVNLQQLQRKHPDKWENIFQADQYFRTQYDQLIDQVNKVRSSLYPDKKDKLVPRRDDYYHHFQELEGFEGIKNLFETPGNIDPKLEGISPFTQPKTKFQGFMQKRGVGPYKSDAVGGYLKYLQAASHSINIDPVIPVVRKTANEIAEATTQTKNANKIIEALQDHANDLAGKTNPYDRMIQKLTGRQLFRGINALNSRVKSNMIVGNLSSALGQAGNVPLGIGKVKQYAAPGLADTLTQTANQVLSKTKLVEKNIDTPIYKSEFMKERYADQFYKRFDQKLIEQPKKLALWMMETVDKSSTSFIWNSMYRKGLGEGVEDAIKYADTETRNVVAGRGVGEVPLLQKSKTAQIFIPFTLEVGNQWTVLRKMVGEKDAAGLMTFLIASYGLNKAMEEVRGSGVSFDPAGAVQEGYTKTEGDTGQKVLGGLASLNGEVVGNIPGGNLLTQMVDTEKKVPVLGIQYKELFGERNPNRFGSGLTISKAVADPLYAALPWGASQVRKTTQGLDAIRNKAVYKGDNDFLPFKTPENELKYPVETSPLKNLQSALMGPSSVSEAKDYYGRDGKPLSEKQTEVFNAIQKNGGDANAYYNDLTNTRKYNTLIDKLKELDKNKELSAEEKQKQAEEIIRQLQELQK